MRTSEYDKMHKLETDYWWFVGRRYLVSSFLKKHSGNNKTKKALDVGCGTGEMLNMLGKYGNVIGLDTSDLALKYCLKRNLKVQKGDVQSIPFPSNSFSIITLLDILEHVEDDEKAIREIHRVCKPKGEILITVPAYNFLWSDHDRALHHYRRYTAKEIAKKLKKAGFRIDKISYSIFFLFLPILVFRTVQKAFYFLPKKNPETSLILVPKPLNLFFVGLLKLETRIIKLTRLPFGVSIIIAAHKTTRSTYSSESI